MKNNNDNMESIQTDYKADCAVTVNSGMAFAKEANDIKDASDIEFAKEDELYTAYSPDSIF